MSDDTTLSKDSENPVNGGIVRAQTSALAEGHSYLDRMRAFAARSETRTQHGVEYIRFPLGKLSAVTERPVAMRELSAVMQEHFGDGDGIVAQPLGDRSIYIAKRYFDQMTEKSAKAVYHVLEPVALKEMSIAQNQQIMEEIAGKKFEVSRTQFGNTPKVFYITHHWKEREHDDGKQFRPLRHLAKRLNQALGEKFFKGGWHEGNYAYLTINESDFPKLENHPKLDEVKAIFAEPMNACVEYDRKTLRGRAARALRQYPHYTAESTHALPAHNTAPKAEEPWHPADDRCEGKPTFAEALSRVNGNQDAPGMAQGI